MTAANSHRDADGPVFASTRFGNVLGSSGSVVKIFARQIANGGPLTLTDPNMSRFVMSLDEAIRLVIDSTGKAHGGEVFVTKMPSLRIEDLAYTMRDTLAPRFGLNPQDIQIELIGVKPGEKLYEELMNQEETRRTVELEEYFAILPAFRNIYKNINYEFDDLVSEDVSEPYISANEDLLDRGEILQILENYKLLDPPG